MITIMTPGTMSFFVLFSQAVFLTFASRIIDSACSMPVTDQVEICSRLFIRAHSVSTFYGSYMLLNNLYASTPHFASESSMALAGSVSQYVWSTIYSLFEMCM